VSDYQEMARNGYSNSKNIRDGHNGSARANSGSPRANIFDHYMSAKDVQAGLLSGTVLKGILRVNPNNWKIAYVSCEGITIDICIDVVKMRNRAIHEDLVALQLLPKSEWLPTVSKAILSDDSIDNSFEFPKNGNENIIQKDLWQAQNTLLVPEVKEATEYVCVNPLNSLLLEVDEYCRNNQVQPRAKIVNILECKHKIAHNGSLIAGCQLREGQRLPESEHSVSFRPTDRRYPNLHIQRMQLPTAYILNPLAQSSKIFCAEIQDPWSATSNNPLGKNLRSVGEIGSIHDETAAILTSYGVDHAPHSDEMIQPLRDMLFQGVSQFTQNLEEKVNWTIPDSEIAKRRDLRSYRIFTIDPYNAKDLDDALHITPRDDGNFEIG
jgi:exoribonuclease R